MDFSNNSEWEDINSWIAHTLSNNTAPNQTVKSPSVSGSDPDTSGSRRLNGVSKGKITKRKSRAAKKNTTTFIAANPANFRRMVQQVTGFKIGNGQVPVAPLLKPEPHRLVDRIQGGWPTLDTSAYVVGDHQQGVGPTYTVPLSGFAPLGEVDGGGGGGGFSFESFSFPAMES